MKTYPKLESFLTNLAYCVFNEADFLGICDAAGVDWSWPKTLPGDAVTEFRSDLDKIGREKALAKQRPVISMLTQMITKLSDLPADIESMRIEYRDLCRVQKAIDTANAVIKDPDSHERLFAGLQTYESNAVATVDHAALIEAYRLSKIEMETRGPKVLIPGFEGTSELVGGFNPARITLLLAQSGFGKSNLAMNLAYAAADKMAVGYMNLEMSIADVANRAAVFRSGKTWVDLYANQIDVSQANQPLRHELRVSDGRELHIGAMISWARAFKKTNPEFGLFIVDYDQKILVNTNRDTPEWKAIHMAIKELEELAKAIQIHVIVVAQFNRQGELASSWRIINSAHTVLKFREYKGGVVIENSIKARHAKYPCAVYVNYNKAGAKITEKLPIEIFDFNEDESKTPDKPNASSFSTVMKGASSGPNLFRR